MYDEIPWTPLLILVQGDIQKWSFVESLKKDVFGIASLRENGILKTETKVKAYICYRQFQSAKATLTRPLKGLVRSPQWGT